MTDIRGLAYVVASHRDPQAWRAFGEQVLGMQAVASPAGELWLRMDERAYRILVVEGDEDRYLASGWELPDQRAFADAIEALNRRDIEVHLGDPALKKSRHCIDVAWFVDPSGNRHELVLGFKTGFQRFVSPTGTQFVTGDLGMGHTALPAPSFDATLAVMSDVLGFGLSDLMNHRPDPNGPAARIYFLHCNNGRHHSLALAEMPVPSGCLHMMVEVPDMDEVGRAMDRQRRAGVKLMATLGRHVNDRMTSFYLLTPSNFALEFGYGGKVCDWNRNVVHETTEVSLWGHDFSVGFG